MVNLLHVIVIFLLLLLIAFAVPKLQPLLYTVLFFLFFLYILTSVVFPFAKMYVHVFDDLPGPFTKLLIGSAVLFFISDIIAGHIEEAGYASLAKLSHFTIKIVILTLWIEQTTELIDILSSLIKK